jgi:hypothetical protein
MFYCHRDKVWLKPDFESDDKNFRGAVDKPRSLGRILNSVEEIILNE